MEEPEETTYCRLCAEPTPEKQLITMEEDVAVSSKIVKKLQWINIDMSPENKLPTTICFSCFDMLERTWIFLNNVRTAQVKLKEIYGDKKEELSEIDGVEDSSIGRPADKDWEEFWMEDSKVDQVCIVDPTFLLKQVKVECVSENESRNEQNSSDSDMPLHLAVKKKKIKKKKELNLQFSWDDYMCRCAKCDAQCKNIIALRLHSLQIHTCCCVFKCSDCDKVIYNFKTFVKHVRLHKKTLRHCCEYCNKQFQLKDDLSKHRSTDHRLRNSMSCRNCGSYFENSNQLQDHLELYTKNQKRKKDDALEYDLKCNLCEKTFKSRNSLKQHQFLHTERTRDYSCHVCGKMFFTKGALCTHMLTHDDIRPFKCQFCPLAFRSRGNLVSHSSMHSSVKPFVCEQCGKCFRVKRHLKSHLIVHTDLMPFICDYCNKTFRFKTRLNLHLRQHTGAKPYNCQLCQRDFTNGSNFKKHMKRRHNIDISKKKYNNIVDDEIKLKKDENQIETS